MWSCQFSKHPVQTHLSDWENVEYSHDWMKSQQINSLSKTGLGIFFSLVKKCATYIYPPAMGWIPL